MQRHAEDFGSDYKRDEVIASTGGKHALFNAMQVLVDHGDEVICRCRTGFRSKTSSSTRAESACYSRRTKSQGFRVTAEMIERLITPRTQRHHSQLAVESVRRGHEPDRYDAMCVLAHDRGIWVISDECYVYLNYTGENFSRPDRSRMPRSTWSLSGRCRRPTR